MVVEVKEYEGTFNVYLQSYDSSLQCVFQGTEQDMDTLQHTILFALHKYRNTPEYREAEKKSREEWQRRRKELGKEFHYD